MQGQRQALNTAQSAALQTTQLIRQQQRKVKFLHSFSSSTELKLTVEKQQTHCCNTECYLPTVDNVKEHGNTVVVQYFG